MMDAATPESKPGAVVAITAAPPPLAAPPPAEPRPAEPRPAEPRPAGERLEEKFVEGYIDGVNGRKVAGWAWCRSDPAIAVDVEIHVGERLAAVARADVFRSDLAKAGVGDGRHGFSALLDDPVAPEDKGRVTALVRCGDGVGKVALINRSIKPSTAPVPAPAPDATPVLPALNALRQGLEAKLEALSKTLLATPAARNDGAAKEHAQIVTDLGLLREELTRLASSTELLQLRVDGVHAAVSGDGTNPRPRMGDERVLTIVVGVLGVISCSALALGLIAVFL